MFERDIAFSSCPNDTFIFHAMLHDFVDVGDYKFKPYISDVEELNEFAFAKRFAISKLSFHAYLLLKDSYKLLSSGAALGYGCGPLLITSNKNKKKLSEMKIAVPGKYTTAFMLLKLWFPEVKNVVFTRFDFIMDGINNGLYDAGVIIHEGRFIFESMGLKSIVDLGEWWESETSMPIPLGCIAMRDDGVAGEEKEISKIIKSSIKFAYKNPEKSKAYIKQHSQELEDSVIQEHIGLYVNDFSIDLGEKGWDAIHKLEDMAHQRGILK